MTTVPASLYAVQSPQLGLSAVVGPVPTHTIEMTLCWHERTHADPTAAGFRAIVRRAVLHASRGSASSQRIERVFVPFSMSRLPTSVKRGGREKRATPDWG